MPHLFPQEAVLRDERRILIRPFTENDTEALWEFFQRLPEEVRRFAWERIDDREVVERWGQNLDYGKVFPLLALDGKKVIADATLHRREHGPLRRSGRIKWLLDPEYRGAGLGSTLVNHFISTARENGMRHLTCMLISDIEKDAIATLLEVGFQAHTFPGYGTDPDGNAHDMTKMLLRL